ncbi:MAG: NAD(P)-dependent alcohol dehydrogenase [Anaerolineaceae bacterium]|nr:NAD(P)-dependent alcohol dehydrogenase [Anaerolineaceae bacterium]
MKAIVQTKFGSPDVLELQEVEKPTPKNGEVLIEVHAAALNAYDWHILVGEPFSFRSVLKTKNKILGADIAGQVEAIGRNVEQFRPGDEVFGDNASRGAGGFAEYVCASENLLALKPAQITFEEAAA